MTICVILEKQKSRNLAKNSWIEACIEEPLPETHLLEEALRNGVILAKLAMYFQPTAVKKIFEVL